MAPVENTFPKMRNKRPDKTHPPSSSLSTSSPPPSSSSSIMWFTSAAILWNLLTSSSNAMDLGSQGLIDRCPQRSINENLRTLQRCHPTEFEEVISCGNERKTLACLKGRYIAVHSASAGKSRALADCVQTAITNETDCSVECVVNEVNELCLGKRRCQIGADDKLFSKPCWVSSSAPPEHGFLWLLFTCVNKNVTRDFHKKANEPAMDDISCLDGVDSSTGSTPEVLRLQETSGTTTSGLQAKRFNEEEDDPTAHNSNRNTTKGESSTPKSVAKSTLSDFSSILVDLVAVNTTSPPQKTVEKRTNSFAYFGGFSEMVWVLNYVSDNTEKCILYVTLGFCLGFILVLVVLIIRSLYWKRKSERFQFPVVGARMTDSSNSLKWRSAESESSVDDDDVRGAAAPLAHPGGRPWLHGRPIRVWSPSSARSPDHTLPVSPTQLEAKPNGMKLQGPRIDENDALSSDEAAPWPPGTQSLTRAPHPPHHTKGSNYYFPDPKSLTIQPSNTQHIEF